MLKVLFVCTGNSARSIMAEAIANQRYGGEIRAWSAGAKPTGTVHPLTIKTLQAQGLSVDGLESKAWDRFLGQPIDLVITVCDAAHEAACPEFPGGPSRVHWHLPDPPQDEHPEDMFAAVFDAIDEAIGLMLYAPDPTPVGRAREAARQLSRRFTPKAV
jgi:arsenate reductase